MRAMCDGGRITLAAVAGRCRAALGREGATLRDALAETYAAFFPSEWILPGGECLMAQRILDMYDEYQVQLSLCRRDRNAFFGQALSDARELSLNERQLKDLVCQFAREAGVFQPAGQRVGASALADACEDYFRRAAFEPQAEGISGLDGRAAACILALASYVCIKRGEMQGVHPEISLDSISLLAFGVAEEQSEGSGKAKGFAPAALMVAAVLIPIYMMATQLPVLRACVSALAGLLQWMFDGLCAVLGVAIPEKQAANEDLNARQKNRLTHVRNAAELHEKNKQDEWN